MSIEHITTIVNQGVKAFADGKKLDANPYVNNPEFHMHWMNGFHQAAMAAEPAAAPVETEQVQQVQLPEATPPEETPVEEAPAPEAKPAKASKSKE